MYESINIKLADSCFLRCYNVLTGKLSELRMSEKLTGKNAEREDG
jgi:hypothetical protein